VPKEVSFATKPRLAVQMIGRSIAANVPFAWVAADSVYGVGELGLDHNETRSWHGWHRHTSLVMLAFAMMASIRHRANQPAPSQTPPNPTRKRQSSSAGRSRKSDVSRPAWPSGIFSLPWSLLLNDFPAGHHTAYSGDLADTDLHVEQTCSDL